MRKNYVMKSVLILMAVVLGSFSQLSAQNYFTTGALTTSTGNSTANTGPSIFGCYYTENRNQLLYTAADLTALGMTAGGISSIGFNIANVPGKSNYDGFTIKMDTTSITALGNAFEAGVGTSPVGGTVYSNASYPVQTGWNQFTFSMLFIWDGVSNIIIETCWDNGTSNYTSPNGDMYYQTTSFNSNIASYSDNQNGCTLTYISSWNPKTYQPIARFEQPVPDDASISTLLSPSFPNCAIDSNVTVRLYNGASNNITSATIGWTVNGSVQPSMSWTGNLAPGEADTVNLGNYMSGFVNDDVLVVYSSNPNGNVDPVQSNDTLSTMLHASLSGVYTIDMSGAGDYLSFTAAVASLQTFGVCSAVTFEAVDTAYVEQFSIGLIDGVSATSTITFTSQTGNAADVKLSYSATSGTDNFVVMLDATAYVIFENLTFEALSTSYGRTMVTTTSGGNENITINNCVFEGITATSTWNSAYYATYFYGAGNDNWTFTNNTIYNGNYGLYMFGNYNDRNSNNVIENNKFLNQYYTGAYVLYQADLMFKDNYTTSSSTYTSGYGMRVHYTSGGEISGNFVEGTLSWPRYGMYIQSAEGGLAQNMPVKNNRVYLPSTNAFYGFYYYSNLFTSFVHNSVYMNGTSASSRALYVGAGGYNVIMNNIIQHGGVGYGVYNNGGIYQMDHNNISAPLGNVGYFGGIQPTLVDWQMATSFDSNSVSVNTVFSDTASLKVCTDSLFQKGIAMAGYTEDFEGDLRNDPPCIGADEYMPISEFGFDYDPVLCNGDTLILRQDYFELVVWDTVDTSNVLVVTSSASHSVAVYGECGSDTSTFDVLPQQMPVLADTNLCEGVTATLTTGISGGLYMWSNGSTDSTVMVDSAQTLTVMIVDAFGCESADTSVVTQSYDVELPAIDSFCTGLNTVLTANVTGSYVWSTGSNSSFITVSTAGSYTVTVTDLNCESNATSVVHEVYDAVPSFTDSSDFYTVIFTNTSTNADTYDWNFGDGSPNSSLENPIHLFPYTGVAVTEYVVTLTATNHCGPVDFIKETVRAGELVSVSNIELTSMINVYPNPNNGVFNVVVKTDEAADMTIEVLDVRGAIIYTQAYGTINGEFSRSINLDGAAQGIYFVKVTLNNETAVYRLSVN